jgi:predicted Rossmann fold nucleotide-binding protein DprA/Smf involved in DNA uptake
MSLGTQAQAVVLLTAYLAKPGKGEPRPLSPREWGRFALWLKDHDLQPESLLTEEPSKLLAGLLDKTVSVPRVEALLGRGGALGLALEKWERVGLWVMARSDVDYPERLKRRLRTDSPPLLFGCGDRRLLGNGGLAVVGSRDAGHADLAFAAKLGAQGSRQGISIVSGGARGIDEAAMLGALENEGVAIGVLADNLMRAAISAKYRKHLMTKNLVLVSPYNPEAGFEVGNAMARNRYIYCLSDAAVVVSSTRNTGGTWMGAIENLKEGWVPLWVKPGSEGASGNAELVRRGARWLPDVEHELSGLLVPAGEAETGPAEPASVLLDVPVGETSRSEGLVGESTFSGEGRGGDRLTVSVDECLPAQPENSSPALGFYELFIFKMRSLSATTPMTLEQLQDCLDVAKTQLSSWLKRAVAEGTIQKLSKPVRYRWQGTPPRQASMFSDDSVEKRSTTKRATG